MQKDQIPQKNTLRYFEYRILLSVLRQSCYLIMVKRCVDVLFLVSERMIFNSLLPFGKSFTAIISVPLLPSYSASNHLPFKYALYDDMPERLSLIFT